MLNKLFIQSRATYWDNRNNSLNDLHHQLLQCFYVHLQKYFQRKISQVLPSIKKNWKPYQSPASHVNATTLEAITNFLLFFCDFQHSLLSMGNHIQIKIN